MNTNLQLQFQKLLSKNNYRCTEERRVLFSTLKNQSNPCTIQELVTATSGSLDPATVYRNVELFEKLNVVHRVYTGWKYKVELSDDFRDHHHHMTCTNCSAVISFEESTTLLNEFKKLENQNNFRVSSHSLELVGFCQNCC